MSNGYADAVCCAVRNRNLADEHGGTFQWRPGYDQAVVESHPITNLIWIAAKDMASCGRKELLDVVKLLFPIDPTPDGTAPSTATDKSDIAQRYLMKNLSCVFKKVKSTPSSNNISMIIVLVAMLILLCEEVSLRGYGHELHCTLVEFFYQELHAIDVVHYKRCQQTQSTFTNFGIPQMLSLITIMSILACLTLSYMYIIGDVHTHTHTHTYRLHTQLD